jgi:hypothetical protein
MVRVLTILALSVLPLPASAAECTCRALGRDFVVGTTICLSTPSGARLATCDMMVNNTTWRFSASPCVAASLDQAQSQPTESVAAEPQGTGEYTLALTQP